jgi:tripartite-type tricarboxylate transporter receptor subunit TctC
MKKTLLFALCALVILGGSVFAAGQKDAAYPRKAIDLIVPASAGSGGDVLTRIFAKYLALELNVAVNVNNQGGGNGIPAVQAMLKANPDGHTLLADQALASAYQLLLPNLPYQVDDRSYIARIGKGPQVLCIGPNSPWQDLNDVAKFAKESPEKFIWGGISASSAADLVQLQFMKAAGVDVTKTKKLAYTGGGEILSAIAGGHILFGTSAASGVPPFSQSGKVKPLVISGSSRLGALPGVKSAAEQGFPAVDIGFWVGFSGQKDLPKEVVDTLNSAIQRFIKRADFLQDIDRVGVVLSYAGPEQMKKDVHEEAAAVKALQLYGAGK